MLKYSVKNRYSDGMRRAVKIIGIGVVVLVLILFSWFVFEYQKIREGLFKLNALPMINFSRSVFPLGNENSLEMEIVRAVYLGRRDKCREGKKRCDIRLSFLGLDKGRNLVLFSVYGGWNGEEESLVKILSSNGEEIYAIEDFTSDELLKMLEEREIVELHVIKKIDITDDFEAENESVSKLINLFINQEAKASELLARFQEVNQGEDEVVSLVKGFWGYRDTVLPVFLFNLLW